MTLRGIVRIYVAAAVGLLAALLGCSLAVVSTIKRAASAERAGGPIPFSWPPELRQTSDDLTRMARTYVVTAEPRFRAYFEEILAICDGRTPHPEAYPAFIGTW